MKASCGRSIAFVTLVGIFFGAPGFAEERAKVSAKRAVSFFDAICGQSVPDFEQSRLVGESLGFKVGPADDRLRDGGIRVVNGSPEIVTASSSMFHPSEDMQFGLIAGPAGSNSCIFVFGTNNVDPAVISALRGIARQDSSTDPTRYTFGGDHQQSVTVHAIPRSNGRNYYHIELDASKMATGGKVKP